MTQTVLYSFRRCPYAIRARLAIAISSVHVELREVVLRDKPPSLLDYSSKATVPVLITADQTVIDESIDIMFWALQQADPQSWLYDLNSAQHQLSQQLIENNDGEFKDFLDRYKYADRYPEHPQEYYRQQAEKTLVNLELLLAKNGYLVADKISLADMAILPFIRQFAFVDKAWFDTSPYPLLKTWLDNFLNSDLFSSIMLKYPPWQEGDNVTLFLT
ncbi:MAG: glutathione S-transferase [Piscirickettsiaceae bacterium]|nr:glutathione S-transferase [Piscirickettsiaceae bacterium]